MVMHLWLLYDLLEDRWLREVMMPEHKTRWETTTDLKKVSAYSSYKAAEEAGERYPCRDTLIIRPILVTQPSKCTIGIEA